MANEAELRAALLETVENLEEIVLLLCEAGMRYKGKVLDVDFEKETDVTYLEAAKVYEQIAKSTRTKFNLPKENDDNAVGSNAT